MTIVTAIYKQEGNDWLVRFKEDETFHSFRHTLQEAMDAAKALRELYNEEFGVDAELVHEMPRDIIRA